MTALSPLAIAPEIGRRPLLLDRLDLLLFTGEVKESP